MLLTVTGLHVELDFSVSELLLHHLVIAVYCFYYISSTIFHLQIIILNKDSIFTNFTHKINY